MQLTHDIQKATDISHLVTLVLGNEDAVKLKSEYDRGVIEGSHLLGTVNGIVVTLGRSNRE